MFEDNRPLRIFKILGKEIQLVLRSLSSHKIRTVFSIFGVIFGVAAVIAMMSVSEGAKEQVLKLVRQLGATTIVVRSGGPLKETSPHEVESKDETLSLFDMKALAQNIPSLMQIAPLRVVEGEALQANIQMTPEILATTRSFGKMKGLEPVQGRFLSDLDQKKKAQVCVLGSEVASTLGKNGSIGSILKIGEKVFVVVGVLQASHWKKGTKTFFTNRNLNQVIFVPIGAVEGREGGDFQLTEIILQIREEKEMNTTIDLMKKILKKMHDGIEDFQVVAPKELLTQADETRHAFGLSLIAIGGISLLLGGIGIVNMLLKIVSERTREIGIRRAVGASKRRILLQFLLEAILLNFVGAVFGIGLGIALSAGIALFFGWQVIVTPLSIIAALGMSFILGIFSGIYPAYLAAHMDPIKALRYDA